MYGYGFVLPAPVLTPEQVRSAANRAALHADGLTEVPSQAAPVSLVAAPKLEAVDRGKLTLAAFRARKALPGPIGACVSEHLTTWSELGFRYGGAGSIAQLVEAVMALPLPEPEPAAA